MANEGQKTPGAAVEEAIARVLASERDAREAIANARREAAETAEESRAFARALGERTDVRIRKVRSAFERALAARLEELHAAEAQIETRHDLTDEDRARLDRAIARLAARLTGGER
jgi:hypothetical protein